MTDPKHLPLIGTLALQNGLGSLLSLEVRTDEHSNLTLTLWQAGERLPLHKIMRTGQDLPPLRLAGDNDEVMRGMAEWANRGLCHVLGITIYPTVIHRVGPTPGAAHALREMSENMAAQLLATPEVFLAVSHIEVRAELYRRRAQADKDKAAGLEVRRLRAARWAIPEHNPITERGQ